MLNIDLSKLNFQFTSKPPLVGGKAMEYYGLRPAGSDIDFVVSAEDHTRLWQQYPDCHKDLWADYGVCVHEFELWDSIMLFDYAALSAGAVEEADMLAISLEKLLLLKALAMREPKYHRDLELVVERITRQQYETLYSPKRAAQFSGSCFIGQWQLDPAQSVYEFGQPPASGLYTIEFDGRQIHFTIEWTTVEGQAMRVLVDAIPDGLDHSYDGPAADAICYTLVDAFTLDSTAKKIVTDANGEKQEQVVATARRVLSEDGNTMRITQSGDTPDGKHYDNVSVYWRV